MMKCWENDPDKRPTFTDLKNQLKEMENQHRVRQRHIDLDSIFGNQVVKNAISPYIPRCISMCGVAVSYHTTFNLS